MFKVGDRVRVISKTAYSVSDFGSWGYVTGKSSYEDVVKVRFELLTGDPAEYYIRFPDFDIEERYLELLPLTKLEKALK